LNYKTAHASRRYLSGFNELIPGFLVCLMIALATKFVAEHYGGPVLLYALLFGMSLHFLSEGGRCVKGIEFASRSILRLGVALLGFRITIDQISELGISPFVMVVVSVLLTILSGALLARVLGLSRDLGLLTGGASAALAISAVMPRNEKTEQNTILTVVGVTTLSTLAMITYPLIVGAFGLTGASAGIFLGGTIHDVAQVVGAGYLISDEVGEISTVVKLLRVATLVPVVLCFIYFYSRGAATSNVGKGLMPPGFLVAFVVLVIINSVGIVPVAIVEELSDLSRWCLIIAIGALAACRT